MNTRRRVWSGQVVLSLLLAGCTGTGPVESSPAAAPASGPPPVACTHALDSLDAPPTDLVVVADSVAVPVRPVLQVAPADDAGPTRFFAKTGLVVRAEVVVELRIRSSSAGQSWIGWGSPAQPAHEVRLAGCPDRSGWLVFAGGYWVDEPSCLSMTVRAADREEQVRISVGARCPE